MQVNLFPRSAKRPVRAFFAFTLLGVAVLYASEHANAQQSASVAISVKDHRFQPSQITAPANRPISIKVKNLDNAYGIRERFAAPGKGSFGKGHRARQ